MSTSPPRARHRSLTPAAIATLFERLAALDPEPRTELLYASDFQLLVAVVLSAQSTDVGVNKVTRMLFARAPTPAAMLALGETELARRIGSLGLFRIKARNVIALCRLLLERHDGAVPRTREALQALPGVGRKTANVVLNVAFGEPTIAVDTHIFRVANRTGLAPGRNVDAVEAALLTRVPAVFRQHAHHWLILHGRYVCKARAPDCGQCVLRDLCLWKDKTGAATQ
ncbi:endonuclease III [Metallibacterium sp.]|uniref:endonuclease III n=1 Tax=Metallibacterium sp. TaxID=2940281 RepID=UPI0026386038|nr:endonuclease III [Metallibacterium sp.]